MSGLFGRRRYPTSRATSGSTFSSAPPRGRWIPFDLRHKVGAIFYWLRAPTWQLTQTNDDREKTLNLQANARAYKEIHPRFALLIKILESSASFGVYILENLRIGLWTRLRCVRGSSCLFFLFSSKFLFRCRLLFPWYLHVILILDLFKIIPKPLQRKLALFITQQIAQTFRKSISFWATILGDHSFWSFR